VYQLQEPASRDAARVNVSRFNAALDMSGVRQVVLQAAAALPLDLQLTALSRCALPASIAWLTSAQAARLCVGAQGRQAACIYLPMASTRPLQVVTSFHTRTTTSPQPMCMLTPG
jgi:hypothetical protein